MRLLARLGWRNLWRNKRRSLLTIIAIAVATAFTIIMRGMAVGTWEHNIQYTVELFAGSLQLQRSGYNDKPSLQKNIRLSLTLDSLLATDTRISGHAPRLQTEGLIGADDHTMGAFVLGIVPEEERRISRFEHKLSSGVFLRSESRAAVVVGQKLLENLDAQVGDTVVVLAQGFDGILGNEKFVIVGAVKMGIPQFDRNAVIMNLSDLQALLAMEGRATTIVLSVPDLHEIDPVASSFRRSLQEAGFLDIDALPWFEVLPELEQSMEFDLIGDWFFLGILIVIVTFGIMNTLLMSVTERFREFGVVLALGMRHGSLARIVLIETVVMAAIGISVGDGIGLGVTAYVQAHPISFTGALGAIYEEYGFQPLLLCVSRVGIAATVSGVILLITLLASIYPLYRVFRLEPMKGIRRT